MIIHKKTEHYNVVKEGFIAGPLLDCISLARYTVYVFKLEIWSVSVSVHPHTQQPKI